VSNQTHKKASGFVNGEIHGGKIMDGFPFAGMLIRVTKVTTSTSVFEAEVLRSFGETVGDLTLDDLFNSGWKIKCILATEASNIGLIRDITDFDIDLGQVTTAVMAATYTVGDILALIPDEIALPAGQIFTVTKRITKIAVTYAIAVDVTGVSSGGTVGLIKAAIQNGANAAGGATTGIFIKSNDANEPLNIEMVAQGADLTARKFVSKEIGYQVASGKKITIQAGTADLSGTGSITVHLTFVRSAGAIIAAA